MSVTVYSTPTCPWCHRAKDYLRSKNVIFEEVDVSTDQERAREMVQKSGQMGVPVIEIGEKVVIGFDPAVIDELLNLSK